MDIASLFRERFGTDPDFLASSPGRVNLLGEHVDYNDGPVLPMAIDRRVHVAAREISGRHVHLYAHDLKQETTFDLDALESKVDLSGAPLPDWAFYPAGVAYELKKMDFAIKGLQALYSSEIPIGAGLSSSAAVEVAFGVLWTAFSNKQIGRMQLARLCQQAENEYVGVNCGLMDQFAVVFGVPGHALYLDTRSLDWRPAPLPEGTAIVIANSNAPRTLSGSEYNQRREACQKAVEILRGYLPELDSLRDIAVTEFAAYATVLPDDIRRRAEHVVREIVRVESALSALESSDGRAFGALMYAGHASLRDLYEVSTPELDGLVEIARTLPGCLGARLTGAGFGGCTVNLVEEHTAQAFLSALDSGYREMFGREPDVFITKASAGASANRYGTMDT